MPPDASQRARQLDDAQHVGERLLAGRRRMNAACARVAVEQRGDRVRDRAQVAPAVQLAEHASAVGDRRAGARDRLVRRRRAGTRNGCRRADALAVREQRLVAEREERAAQRAVDRELVVRPLDRGERGAQALDLLALVERLAADQHVRDAARLERLDVRLRDVGAALREAPEQQAHVPRRDGQILARPLALRHAPAALLDEPVHERGRPRRAATRRSPSWSGPIARTAAARAARPRSAGPAARRDTPRAARSPPAAWPRSSHHARRERRVDGRWIAGTARKLVAQLDHGRAAAAQERLHLLVDADVGAAEAVDRLLRVADDEELARHRRHLAPVARRRDRRPRAAAGSRPGAGRCPGTRRRRCA